MTDRRARRILFPLLAPTIAMLGFAIALELVLRLLPVADARRRMPVDERNPVIRFEPNRDLTYSRDWNLRRVIEHRVNNDGFLNPADYDPAATSPLLAIVGDSFVEALMVPWERTAAGRLAATLGDRARVYTFGMSSAPLTTYLVYARHARDLYRPDRMVVVIISNDFDEGVAGRERIPGHPVFEWAASGEVVLERRDFRPARLTAWARSSALARYLVLNARVTTAPQQIRHRLGARADETRWVGNVERGADPARIRDSERAVDAFLARLPDDAGLEPSEILFLVDGIRPQLYEPDELDSVRDSFAARMNRTFIDRALDAGYEVVDLEPLFVARHRADGSRFEFEDDAHWNAVGHEVAARAILESSVLESWLSAHEIPDPDRLAP